MHRTTLFFVISTALVIGGGSIGCGSTPTGDCIGAGCAVEPGASTVPASLVDLCYGDYQCALEAQQTTTVVHLAKKNGVCMIDGTIALKPDGTVDSSNATWSGSASRFELCAQGMCATCTSITPNGLTEECIAYNNDGDVRHCGGDSDCKCGYSCVEDGYTSGGYYVEHWCVLHCDSDEDCIQKTNGIRRHCDTTGTDSLCLD